MIRAAFLSFYRSLTRHPLYSALNLLGLSFGIAVFIVLSLYIRFETSYEQWLPNADRIYEIAHRTPSMAQFSYSSAGYALDAIHQVRPDLTGTRVFPAYFTVSVNGHHVENTGQLVDSDFFSIFDLPVLAGDRIAALRAPDGVILTESVARRYFDRTNVVGERVFIREDTYADADQQAERPWRVLAVLKDLPANSSLEVGFIRSLAAYQAEEGSPSLWGFWSESQRARTFILLRPEQGGAALLPMLAKAIKGFSVQATLITDRQIEARKALQIGLFSFSAEHVANPRLREILAGVTVLAILTLAIALINYANLAVAHVAGRAKEGVMRRIHGVTPARLTGQLLVEAALTGGVCLVLAFSMVEIGLPMVNRIVNMSLRLDYRQDGLLLVGLSGAVILGSLIAGALPANVLARLRPVQVLGTTRRVGGRYMAVLFQNTLTLVQFAAGGVFFIALAGFAAQLRHMETSNLSFSRDHLLVSDNLVGHFNDRALSDAIIHAWNHTPGISGVTRGKTPGRYFGFSFRPTARALPEAPKIQIDFCLIAPDYFKTYDTPILAGRPVGAADDLDRLKGGKVPDLMQVRSTFNAVLNLAAVKSFGFANARSAVGQDLRFGLATVHIVGVVADQRFQGPLMAVSPTVYVIRASDTFFEDVIIRYSGIDEATARRRLEAVWRKFLPDRPLEFTTMRQELDYYYRDDRRNTRLFAIGGGVAALIGAVGLFGMAAFNTSARVHEIGIRKAQGASRWRIMRLLMFQFLRPVLIANIIAWPIAYVVLDAWLKQFDDRVAMSPLFFLAGSGLSILIAAVTVFGVAWSGANLSPAKALRQL